MGYNVISLEEEVRVPAMMPYGDFVEKFMARLADFLREKAYIHNVKLQDNVLIFHGPMFRFAWNGWNLFNPVSNGRIEVLSNGSQFVLNYKIYFWEFFVYSLLFSSIAIFGYFPSQFWRFLYLALVWSFFMLHSLWVKNRLEKYLETLSHQIFDDYRMELDKFMHLEHRP